MILTWRRANSSSDRGCASLFLLLLAAIASLQPEKEGPSRHYPLGPLQIPCEWGTPLPGPRFPQGNKFFAGVNRTGATKLGAASPVASILRAAGRNGAGGKCVIVPAL